MQSPYAIPTLLLAALAVLSVAADGWRHRRRHAGRRDGRVGWMPWPLIAILAAIAAAFCAALWLRGG
jgi:hypothetical protein